jgi:hypothetical protein
MTGKALGAMVPTKKRVCSLFLVVLSFFFLSSVMSTLVIRILLAYLQIWVYIAKQT